MLQCSETHQALKDACLTLSDRLLSQVNLCSEMLNKLTATEYYQYQQQQMTCRDSLTHQ